MSTGSSTAVTASLARSLARFTRRAIVPLLAGAAVLVACDPTTVIDDHPEADGFAISSADEELVRWMVGEAEPTLTLDVGTVYDLVITLLGENGQPIPHDDDDHDDDIVVTIESTSIATWTPEPEDPGHEHEFLEAHGELETLAVGSTRLTVCLEHGDHCDFTGRVTLDVQ